MFPEPLTHRVYRPRSFVRRQGRMTFAQTDALKRLWPQFGLQLTEGLIDVPKIFMRHAPCFLEIGFGMGQSLLALAKAHPDKNFIGVETHKAGIGALFLGIETNHLTNLRVYEADVFDVFATCVTDESLDGILIFFPDPWPKRRHHGRRLIRFEFLKILIEKLKMHGELHLATDWEDYAKQMSHVISQEKKLVNVAGENQFATRSFYRPIITKFEQRALREGRKVWELQFIKH